MNRRRSVVLTPAVDSDRPRLALVRADDLTTSPVVAAERRIEEMNDRIDGRETWQESLRASTVATPVAGPPHASRPVVGKFERFENHDGIDRVQYRYMSEDYEALIGSYPDFGGDPHIEAVIFATWQMILARRAEIRRSKTVRREQ